MSSSALEKWLRSVYRASRVQVVESKTRTVGGLHRVLMDGATRWLRVGGVLRRSLEHTEAEGTALTELHRRGVRVQRPVVRKDGRFAGLLEAGPCPLVAIMYDDVSGIDLEMACAEGMLLWGQELRRLHDAPCASLGSLPVVEPLVGTLARLDLATTWLTPTQGETLRRTIHNALAIAEGLPSRTLCHGDARRSNVRRAEAHVTLIDTEALGRGPRVYDAACAWRECVLSSSGTDAPTGWSALRTGYDRDAPLSEQEWASVPALACLRALWTMTLPAEIPQGWGEDWLDDREYWAAHLAFIERLSSRLAPWDVHAL